MKVAKEIPNLPTLAKLGSSTLELIASLPEEQKQEVLAKEIANSYSGTNIVWKNFTRKFMIVAKELPNFQTFGNLGNEALYLIATLPKEQKQEEIPNSPTLANIKETTLEFIGSP